MYFKDFFNETDISERTCENIVEYYWEHISQYETLKMISILNLNILHKLTRIHHTEELHNT